MRWKTWLLASLSCVILLILFATFRKDQLRLDHPQIPTSDVTLTDRDKAYVDRYMDLTKWLTGISYALLAGLAAKRVADSQDSRFVSFPCLLGIHLLVLSLLAGFLCYESILSVMASEPLWKLRSDLTSFPVSAQLWLLALGTASLAFAFFSAQNVSVTSGGMTENLTGQTTTQSTGQTATQPRSQPKNQAASQPANQTAGSMVPVLLVLALLNLPASLLAQPTPSAPTLSETTQCVVNWEQTRNIIHPQGALGGRATLQETDLVRLTVPAAAAPPAGLPPCSYVDAVLDKVKSDAAAYVFGRARLSITGEKKQFTQVGDFYQNGNILVLETESITAKGEVKEKQFDGQIKAKNAGQALAMLTDQDAQTSATISWKGQVAQSIGGAGKNASVAWVLTPSPHTGTAFDTYLDRTFSIGGGHFGDPTSINQAAQEHFEYATAGLRDWMQSLWTTPKGLVSATCHSSTQLQIMLDQISIGNTPYTFPVSANVPHTLQILNGSVISLQRTFQLKNGDLLELVVP